ncbi:MAG: NnrU family protein [Chromatiales bacterium]
MSALILGLLIFLGVHSVRMVAEGWRVRQIARLGEKRWKGLYSLASAVGLVLIVWGYGVTRAEPVVIWNPPAWTLPVAAVLNLPAFVLIAAAYVPGNSMKPALGHPMVLGVKVWAFAHLISNGGLGDVVLFGAVLVWAVFDYMVARRRDRAAGVRYPAGTLKGDATATVIGLAVWALFAAFLHQWLIGVRPFA